MLWTVAVRLRPGVYDARGAGIQREIEDLGIRGVTSVEMIDVYRIQGDLPHEAIRRIAEELLTDRIIQDYTIDECEEKSAIRPLWSVEVAYNPGVMDPVEGSLRKGIRDLGVDGVMDVQTAKRYMIRGDLDEEAVKRICDSLLVN
ncbi:MAG: phosphoribosylformylglycinamidine synthase subunit PurS, partial [Candidatus Latescibacteria bacterium]|nr:phosphoribosylformylglycinamidine synthase subunit PurS [Candidatus Latescibacterota bacterium]